MSTSLPNACAVIVMGVSGVGKTTLAQALAAAMKCPFIEGDSLHDERSVAKMRAGQALTDEDRWPWLDRVGAALKESASQHGVAVGACSALRKCYRDRLRATASANTRFILLLAPRQTLEARMSTRTGHYMPTSLLDSQLATLEMPSAEDGVLMLDARQSPAELVGAILYWLEHS